MGTRELADLLDRASADVRPPAFAEAAWSRAFHVRRRRRSVVAAASIVTALVVTGGALHSLRPAPEIGGIETATATLGPPTVDRIPANLSGRTVSGLPAAGLTPPRDARTLSGRPVTRAVAAYQLASVEESGFPQPLYVLGTDGTWARIDSVQPTFTRDADGNRADPLRPTAISPDGRFVAVPQPDQVLFIDVTSGGVTTVPVPGFNEQVVWLSDDILAVGQETATFAVAWRLKTVTPVQTNGPTAWNLAGPARSDGSLVELRGDPLAVAQWDITAEQVRREPINSRALRSYEVTEWFGPAIRNDVDLVVRAGFGNTPTVGADNLVAVVDVNTGVVRRMLEPGRDRTKGCCVPLAWVDRFTVLMRTDREGVITWDVRTGEIALVAGPLGGTLAVGMFPGQR